ncbi:MAG: LysM peptidoglycan-binding domain-containing protein, partial [Bacteroidota bacterium]|nr:LysM peptidoglycan-binding domain-containing protein [Bacteroidota bacterium]
MKILFFSVFILSMCSVNAQVENKSNIIEEYDGKKYIIHLVQPGETLQSLSELYGVFVNSIKDANVVLKENNPKANQIVKIPTAAIGEVDRGEEFVEITQDNLLQQEKILQQEISILDTLDKSKFFYHLVEKRETLYSISKKYHVSINQIKEINHNLGSLLQINQKLIIPISVKEEEKEVVSVDDDIKEFKGYKFSYYSVKKKETIYSLCKRFGISKSSLYYMNPYLKDKGLKTNSKIRIPHKNVDISEKEKKYNLRANTSASDVSTVRHYKVKFFETIQGVSRRERVDLETIFEMNPGVRTQGVSWGDVITLPRDAKIIKEIFAFEDKKSGAVKDSAVMFITHVVNKKETLYGISKLYDVELEQIFTINEGLTQNISRNQKIRIPVKKKIKSEFDTDSEVSAVEKKEAESIGDVEEMELCYKKCFNDNTIKVALMIPLFLQDSILYDVNEKTPKVSDYRSFNFIQFYEGAMLAIDTLQKQGMNAEITVFDLGNKVEDAYGIIDTIGDVDIIIGPIYGEPFKVVAKYASDNGIPIVNPLSKRKEIVEENSNVYKVSSSIKPELKAIAKYVNNNYPDSTNIFIIRNNWYWHEDEFAYLKQELNDVNNGANINFKNIIDIEYQKDSLNPMTADTMFFEKQNVVIGLTDNKVFSLELMRHLNELKDSVNIVSVFGLS